MDGHLAMTSCERGIGEEVAPCYSHASQRCRAYAAKRFAPRFRLRWIIQPISRLAKSMGYSCAIANDAGPNDQNGNLYELSRTIIASDDDLATFSARVSGLTWWINRGRRLFRAENDASWEPSFSRPYGSAAAQSYIDS